MLDPSPSPAAFSPRASLNYRRTDVHPSTERIVSRLTLVPSSIQKANVGAEGFRYSENATAEITCISGGLLIPALNAFTGLQSCSTPVSCVLRQRASSELIPRRRQTNNDSVPTLARMCTSKCSSPKIFLSVSAGRLQQRSGQNGCVSTTIFRFSRFLLRTTLVFRSTRIFMAHFLFRPSPSPDQFLSEARDFEFSYAIKAFDEHSFNSRPLQSFMLPASASCAVAANVLHKIFIED